MKNLGVRGMVLLVSVLALAVPAFASPPTEASGYGWLTGVATGPGGELIVIAQWDGTFQGELRHAISDRRAVRGESVGSVAGREGSLDILIPRAWGDPAIPGYHGKWVILGGEGELQNLRGQGTFFFDSPGAGPYEGQIHFDPD